MNKLSIVVTVHNEGKELLSLLTNLQDNVKNMNYDWELLIVDDFSSNATVTEAIELAKVLFGDKLKLTMHSVNKDFAQHKNFYATQCTGDWILQLDADELLPIDKGFMKKIPALIEKNTGAEVFWMPRVNTVTGLTPEHVSKWGWKITTLPEFGDEWIVNFPDYQGRLYMNKPEIKWEGKVHERLVGYKKAVILPAITMCALRHFKSIKKQEAQNKLYETIHD